MARWATRIAALAVGTVAALVWAGAAFAHVEVTADPDTAGATDAVVTFSAEAENPSAGITSVQIVLPSGLGLADIRLKQAPRGWTLTASDNGYTVAGPALPKGEEAVHSIVVARLPNATELVFKALVRYSDNSVDRWIEEKSAANPNPDNPAPVLTLKPASPASGTASPSAPAAPTPAASTTPAVAPGQAGTPVWVWYLIAALGVVVIAGVALLVARRRSAGS